MSNILIGKNKYTGADFYMDFHNSQCGNYNISILGGPGAGKSVLAKIITGGLAEQGVKSIIIDKYEQYREFTNHFNGEYISLSKKSNVCINPFHLTKKYDYSSGKYHLDINSKANNVTKLILLIDSIYDDLSVNNRDVYTLLYLESIIDKAIKELYSDRGFNEDVDSLHIDGEEKPMPTITEFCNKLQSYMEDDDLSANEVIAKELKRLIICLKDSMFSCFDGQTTINFDLDKSSIITFDLNNFNCEYYLVAAYIVLSDAWERLVDSTVDHSKLKIVYDGINDFELNNEYMFNLLSCITRRARPHNVGVVFTTQDPMLSETSAELFRTCNTKIYLKQLIENRDILKIKHRLTDDEIELLTLKANVGDMLIDNGSIIDNNIVKHYIELKHPESYSL